MDNYFNAPGMVAPRQQSIKPYIARSLRYRMTPAEQILWQRLRACQLSGRKFRRQHAIAGFIFDFYCHSERLAVEIDGEVHTAQRTYDAERTRVLEDLGVRVVRFSNLEVVHETDAVLARIRAIVARDAPPLTQPLD